MRKSYIKMIAVLLLCATVVLCAAIPPPYDGPEDPPAQGMNNTVSQVLTV